MVLVTPQQAAMAGSAPRTPCAPSSSRNGDAGFDAVQPGDSRFGAGTTAARDEVLALLREGSERRPRFHPGLAGGLRAWLEDGASELVLARGEDAPPLFLGPRLLWSGAGSSGDLPGRDPDPYPMPLVQSCLVRSLFRQMVTTGRVGDPMSDALDALRVDPSRRDMVRHIEELDEERRATLAAALTTHVTHLVNLTPRFAPGWLPRTDDRVAIPLAGGRVVLCGVFDLLVGAPLPGTATLCAMGLTTGGRWAQARMALHYLALLETLRSGTPPFRVALLHSAVGRYGVEDVLEEHLRAVVSHVAARLTSLARAGREGGNDG
jgi:hypothetical protein